MQAATDPPGPRRRVLLGQLISHGDCLYATTVARQIKHDDPGCHLTWAVSKRSRAVLDGNPHVDAVWEWPAFPNAEIDEAWAEFTRQARARQAAGEFDDLYLTQFVGENLARWEGTLRAAILRGYPGPITVPLAPVMCLSEQEVDRVRQFAARHGLTRKTGKDRPPGDRPVILFECAPGSGQSFMTPAYALEVSRCLLASFPDARVILSSHLPIANDDPRILDGSELSFRENAEVSHYCTLLVGCSSGLTWLCTSEAARPLPTVQLLTDRGGDCNALSLDHARWGLPTDGIIEMFGCPAELACACVKTVLSTGFASARHRFGQRPKIRYDIYGGVLRMLLIRGRFRQAAVLSWRNRSWMLKPSMWLWHVALPMQYLHRKWSRERTETAVAAAPRR